VAREPLGGPLCNFDGPPAIHQIIKKWPAGHLKFTQLIFWQWNSKNLLFWGNESFNNGNKEQYRDFESH